MKRFGEEIDAIRSRAEADLGVRDVIRIRRLNGFSRGMEVVGRALIHFSVEPISFLAGVGALWVHKQLQAIEIEAVQAGAAVASVVVAGNLLQAAFVQSRQQDATLIILEKASVLLGDRRSFWGANTEDVERDGGFSQRFANTGLFLAIQLRGDQQDAPFAICALLQQLQGFLHAQIGASAGYRHD